MKREAPRHFASYCNRVKVVLDEQANLLSCYGVSRGRNTAVLHVRRQSVAIPPFFELEQGLHYDLVMRRPTVASIVYFLAMRSIVRKSRFGVLQGKSSEAQIAFRSLCRRQLLHDGLEPDCRFSSWVSVGRSSSSPPWAITA